MTDEKKELEESPEETTVRQPDCVLSTGKKVYFDKRNITRLQWISLFDPTQSDEEGYRIIAHFACMSMDEYNSLNRYDEQLLLYTAREVMRRPFDPFLDGGSMTP